MAGIRALYQEVADLYTTMNKLHREMLDCHQAQKDREAQLQSGFQAGLRAQEGLRSAQNEIVKLVDEIRRLRSNTMAMLLFFCLATGVISAVSVVLMARAGWLGG